jgi:hypothetical protein
VDAMMKLLGICSKTTYFQVYDEFYQQTDGMALGSPLSPVQATTYNMEHIGKAELEHSAFRPKI